MWRKPQLKSVVVDFTPEMPLSDRQERIWNAQPFALPTELYVGEIRLGDYENDQDLMAATHAIVTTR